MFDQVGKYRIEFLKTIVFSFFSKNYLKQLKMIFVVYVMRILKLVIVVYLKRILKMLHHFLMLNQYDVLMNLLVLKVRIFYLNWFELNKIFL